MTYEIRDGDTYETIIARVYSLREARELADNLHRDTGRHFVIVASEMIYSTSTVGELID